MDSHVRNFFYYLSLMKGCEIEASNSDNAKMITQPCMKLGNNDIFYRHFFLRPYRSKKICLKVLIQYMVPELIIFP